MNTLRQAAQRAVEVMDNHMMRADTDEFYEAKEALRQAIAMSQQPTKLFGPNLEEILNKAGFYRKREWVGLTDEEVSDAIDDVLEGGGWLDVARALEAAIKEKNHG